ncbi:transposable element Tcb2 transposase [Trichonephila clavipes]|nr:transposable element Tcb2 transposase [Trichonephila clavipes]
MLFGIAKATAVLVMADLYLGLSFPRASARHSEFVNWNLSHCGILGNKNTDEQAKRKLLGAVDTRRYPRAENRDWKTISRHLAEANLKSKCPFRALPLTSVHRQLRLQCCQARSMWNVTDWQKVVFSDESRFVLGTDDNCVRVWRRPGERTFPKCSPKAIFQQDNARPHTARVSQDFLRHFQTLPWPSRSPDLSPVELVWDQLKQQVSSCHSIHDLELAVQDLWSHLPQYNIRCLINSMPEREAACIAAGGGPTRY